VRVWDYADASDRPGINHCDEPELEGCIAFFAPAVRRVSSLARCARSSSRSWFVIAFAMVAWWFRNYE
jgi:hypothetical protein